MFDNMFRCPPEFEQMLVDYSKERAALQEQFEIDLARTGRIGPWLERSADNPEKYARGDAQAAWEMYQAGAARSHAPEAKVEAVKKLLYAMKAEVSLSRSRGFDVEVQERYITELAAALRGE